MQRLGIRIPKQKEIITAIDNLFQEVIQNKKNQ